MITDLKHLLILIALTLAAVEISASFSSVWSEIIREFEKNPLHYFGWYTLGKPILLFSWDIFEGLGDLLIYPVFRTPYSDFIIFKFTHYIMHGLHNWLILLSIFGCLAAWLPNSWLNIKSEQRFLACTFSALFAYFLLIHCILKPEARYSIPMRPITYGMSVFGIWYLGYSFRKLFNLVLPRLIRYDNK